MESRNSSYQKALHHSLENGWRLEDVLPHEARLDLRRRLLPDALAGTRGLDFLSPEEKLALNHLRGHSYLRLFGLVEEFILPFVVDHARSRFGEDDAVVRSLLQFASEEAKHIDLFKRFAARFAEDFGASPPVIGPVAPFVAAVLAHHPIGVGLVTLHIEWMTQRHYLESIRDHDIEPLMKGLLKSHFVEEVQHAHLDTLIVEELVRRASPIEVRAGLDDYARLGGVLEAGLHEQVELDLGAFEGRIGRRLPERERELVRMAQRASYRATFLEAGATHPRFLETHRKLQGLAPADFRN